MKRKRWLVLVIGLYFPLLAAGQWTWRNPLPQGNDLNVIRITGPDEVWAAGLAATLMHSTDGGLTWEVRNLKDHTRFMNFTGLDFPGGDTVFLTDYWGYVLRSFDGGITWDSVYYEHDESLNAAVFTDPMHGHIVCSGGKILRTVDGGDTWIPWYHGSSMGFTALSFPNASIGYAAGGTSFILKTTDGGVTWNEVFNDTAWYPGDIRFISPDTGWAAGSNGRVLRTTDGGITWSVQALGDTVTFKAIGVFNSDTLQVSGSAQSTLFMYSYPVRYRSVNGGVTWTRDTTGGGVVWYGDMDCRSDGTAFLADYWGHLEKSQDYGMTWDTLSSALVSGLGWGAGIYDIDFPTVQTGYASTEGGEGGSGGVLKTIDGGATWSKLDFSAPWHSMRAVGFYNENIGCIAGDYLYYTLDGGQNWYLAWSGSVWPGVRSIAYNKPGSNCFAVGDYGLFLRSNNLGQGWSAVTGLPNTTYYGVCFPDESTGYVTGNNALLKTTDGGNTWNVISTSLSMKAICFTSPQKGIGVGNNGWIGLTSDGGATWQQVTTAYTGDCYSVSFAGADTGFIAGDNEDGLGMILKTTDGGNTWKEQYIPNLDEMYSVAAISGNTAFAGGWLCKLLGTTNGGFSVGENPLPAPSALSARVIPNPVASAAVIRYTLPEPARVTITLLDALGNPAGNPVSMQQASGSHDFSIRTEGLSPGIYYARITAGKMTKTRKVIVLSR
ncbi:MAG TPA: YCF48-related protein [Bacteroidales bacterium]|nr:YCF48-related protein [Bacteroidales bacterium]